MRGTGIWWHCKIYTAGKWIAAQLNVMAVTWFVHLSPGSPTQCLNQVSYLPTLWNYDSARRVAGEIQLPACFPKFSNSEKLMREFAVFWRKSNITQYRLQRSNTGKPLPHHFSNKHSTLIRTRDVQIPPISQNGIGHRIGDFDKAWNTLLDINGTSYYTQCLPDIIKSILHGGYMANGLKEPYLCERKISGVKNCRPKPSINIDLQVK